MRCGSNDIQIFALIKEFQVGRDGTHLEFMEKLGLVDELVGQIDKQEFEVVVRLVSLNIRSTRPN